MPASRRPRRPVPDLECVLARLAEVEDRLRRLERRLAAVPPARGRTRSARAAAPTGGPRCPGCTLELPRGHRGDTCAWCGFLLTAVPRKRAPARRRRARG